MGKQAKLAKGKQTSVPTNKGQIAVIVFGGGVNEQAVMQEYESKGYDVKVKEGYAEVWVKS